MMHCEDSGRMTPLCSQKKYLSSARLCFVNKLDSVESTEEIKQHVEDP